MELLTKDLKFKLTVLMRLRHHVSVVLVVVLTMGHTMIVHLKVWVILRRWAKPSHVHVASIVTV